MANVCQILGSAKKPMFGHNVSHANNKTKRRFDVNLQQHSLFSEALNRFIKLRASVHGLRTVRKKGGIDAFLTTTPDRKLTSEMRRYKKIVSKTISKS